jgi:hypothetical protein
MRNLMTGMILLVAVAGLAACSNDPAVRITSGKPKPAAPAPQARSEPIFYNGKTYKLDFGPRGGGVYDMTVSGMTGKQQKDAEAVATSSLGYFACPEGQRGKLQNKPSYANAKWRMQAKCG